MTLENPNEPSVMNDKPMTAWATAAALGIDMSLIEYSLSLKPAERMRFHDSKLKLFLMIEHRAGLERPSEPVPTSLPAEFISSNSNTPSRTLYGNHH